MILSSNYDKQRLIQYFLFFIPILMALIVYGFFLNSPFHFDDIANISKNWSIRQLDFLSQFMIHSRWFGETINRINFLIGGIEPFYYRIFNLITHLFCGVVLFFNTELLCDRQTFSKTLKDQAFQISFFSMIFFLLHPLQTQTVSYVIQARLEGLVTLFVLLSLYFFIRLVSDEKPSFFTHLLGLTAFSFFAISTKELAVVSPLLALLIDFVWFGNFNVERLKKNAFLHVYNFALLFGIFMYFFGFAYCKNILSLSSEVFNNRGKILTEDPSQKISSYRFFISEFIVILHYIRNFVWPFGLCADYSFSLAKTIFSAQVFWPALANLTMCCLAFWSLFKPALKPLGFGYIWFFISLAPRVTLIPCAELACDYKTYLASFGIFFIFAYLIAKFFKLPKELTLLRHPVFLVTIFTLSACSFQRNKVWQDKVLFWEDIIAKNPNNARALNNLGTTLTERGDVDKAILVFEKAIELDPYYPDPLSNLAVAYSSKEKYDEATRVLKKAIVLMPHYPEAFNNLAAMLVKLNQPDEAIPFLEQAVKIRPFYGKAYYNLGQCYLAKQDKQKAWECFKKATEGDLDNAEGFAVLGQASVLAEKYDEAVKAFAIALSKGDDRLETHLKLGHCYVIQGKYYDAEKIFKDIIKIHGPNQITLLSLAELYYSTQNFQQCLDFLQIVDGNKGGLPPQMFQLMSHCLEKINGENEAIKYLESFSKREMDEPTRALLSNELGRVRMQKIMKENNGSCSFTGDEFKNLFVA